MGRIAAIVLILAIFIAPFIALLFRAEAGLVVMALALAAGSLLLRDAREVTPLAMHRWLHAGTFVNLALASACIGLAVWIFWQN